MKPEEIPKEYIDILDGRSGKVHSADGEVMQALAEILTAYKRDIVRRIIKSLSMTDSMTEDDIDG